MARVLILRGHQASPWELRVWEHLPDRFEVTYAVTASNMFDVEQLRLERVKLRALRDFLPRGRAGDLAAVVLGDRYLRLRRHLAGPDIVHAHELYPWFTAQAAIERARYDWKLVVTVWETLPLAEAFRNRRARRNRRIVIGAVDLFLPATERARNALLLEGVPDEKILTTAPGIDIDRFAAGAAAVPPEHLLLSPGRLVWEKGHQDVLRALAALRTGLVTRAAPSPAPRLLIVGSGPEEKRLRWHARELGISDLVEFKRAIPYDEMPRVYARASCMVLASLSSASCSVLAGPPRCFWEEQFGLVLPEAMAARLPVVASRSGAIPEVAGASVNYFPPGDWMELARTLASGPLSRPPGTRAEHRAERLEHYSLPAAAARLAAAYDRVLPSRPPAHGGPVNRRGHPSR